MLLSAPTFAESGRLIVVVPQPIPALSSEPLQPPSPGGAEPSQEPKREADDSQQKAAPDQRGTKDTPLVVQLLPNSEMQGGPDQNAKKGDQSAPPKWWPFPDWPTDVWLAIFTFGLVLVGVLQLIVFGVQARRLGQTIRAMREIAATQATDTQNLLKAARDNAAAAASQATAMQQLHEATAAQARPLRRQAIAALAAARAARKNANIAEAALVGLERPYIFLGQLTGSLGGADDPETLGTKPLQFRVEFDIANKGRMFASIRAINRTILFERAISFANPPYNYAHTLYGGQSIIGAQLRGPSPPHNFKFDDFSSLGIKTTDDKEFKERAFFFFGFIVYEDFMENQWKKGFGFIYSTARYQFLPFGGTVYNYDRRYNGEDDDKFPAEIA
jgi:hypothetical protein